MPGRAKLIICIGVCVCVCVCARVYVNLIYNAYVSVYMMTIGVTLHLEYLCDAISQNLVFIVSSVCDLCNRI